jgi:uncharacterized Zn-finger protein
MKRLNYTNEDEKDFDDDDEVSFCPIENCKRKFTKKHNLEKHLERHTSDGEKIPSICHICGKLIKGLYSLHIKTHEDIKRFRCDDCGKEFRQKVSLQNHVLIHRNEKPFTCSHCQKKFRQKYTMQSHVKNFHLKVRNHPCGKIFCFVLFE